jgi:hypothetical protein
LNLYERYLREVTELAHKEHLEDELQPWIERCTRRKVYWASARDRLQRQKERKRAGKPAPPDTPLVVRQRARDLEAKPAQRDLARPQRGPAVEERAAEWEGLVARLEERALRARARRTLGVDGRPGLGPQAAQRAPRHVWSDEEILQAIQDAAAAGDSGPKPFKEGRRSPSLMTITTRFGSWAAAEALALGPDANAANP